MAGREPGAPLWSEGANEVEGFMCLTDYEYELGAAMGGNRIFPSLEDARAHLKCHRGCGIVRVRVIGIEVVQEGTDPR